MPGQNVSESLILHLLESSVVPLTLEELSRNLPELTWNQIFLAVDELSRRGHIILKRHGYRYEVSVDQQAVRQQAS